MIVSANSDHEIGRLIAEAMERVGKDGVITCETGKSLENEIEVVEGMKFSQGFLSPFFITEKKTQTVEYKDCFVLVADHKITSARSLIPVLKQISEQGRPLLLVTSDGLESEVLNTLILNRMQGMISILIPLLFSNRCIFFLVSKILILDFF